MTDASPEEVIARAIVGWMPVTMAREIIAALSAAGYVIAPKVATEAMALAYMTVRVATIEKEPRPTDIWAAMIAASQEGKK